LSTLKCRPSHRFLERDTRERNKKPCDDVSLPQTRKMRWHEA
jgi:hypothetical protein